MCLFLGLETATQFGSYFHLFAFFFRYFEDSCYSIPRFAHKRIHFAFTFHNQADCYRLYTSSRQGRFHFTPQYWRKFKAYNTVEYTTCLLGIHQIHINITWMLYRFQDSRLGNFVEYDTFGFLRIQSQHFEQMPGNSFSLAVLIGCEPNHICFLGFGLQFLDQLLFVFRYFVSRLVAIRYINTKLLLLQVADMSVTGKDFIIIPQELFNGFCLGRRLYYHKVLLHVQINLGAKVEKKAESHLYNKVCFCFFS